MMYTAYLFDEADQAGTFQSQLWSDFTVCGYMEYNGVLKQYQVLVPTQSDDRRVAELATKRGSIDRMEYIT